PTLFDAATLRQHPFDGQASHSDDGELCERWARLFGARFAIADVAVDELGQTDLSSVIARFTNYGVSDAETYGRGRAVWSRRRKFHSLTHPARVDFLQPIRSIRFPRNLAVAPFLLLVTSIRYGSWLRTAARRLRPSHA